MFTLGGTIAMRATDRGGALPTLSAADLLGAIPGLDSAGVDLTVRDVANKPGASLSFDDMYSLAGDITTALEGGCAGALVVQGTDTIEETAYLLDLLVPSDAPVVVTGAMRNPSLAGADGPANILAAIRVIGSDRARGLGALVVLNDQIHAARWVSKTHTASPAAFTSPGYGPLGCVVEGRVDIPIRLRERSPMLRPVPGRDWHLCIGPQNRAEVTTIESLSRDGTLDPIQQAFVDAGAFQCGFCTPGMIMMCRGLLRDNADPSDDEIRRWLTGSICRCGAYPEIICAVHAAAAAVKSDAGR